jgi:hypothetical protein
MNGIPKTKATQHYGVEGFKRGSEHVENHAIPTGLQEEAFTTLLRAVLLFFYGEFVKFGSALQRSSRDHFVAVVCRPC